MGIGWANEEETKFLQDFMPKYELCQVKRNYQSFWPVLFSAYQTEFPLIEKLWPNLGMTLNSLTEEENELYTKKMKARHESLKEWFRWRANPRSRNTTIAVTKKDLKSIYQPTRKHGHKSYEIFAKLYRDTVEAIVQETCRLQGVTGKAKLPIWHKVASSLWAKATQEQIDAVKAQMENEGEQDQDSDEEDTMGKTSPTSPETYQHYLKLLPGVLTATVDPAVRKAGVMALCTIIGPVPEAGGQIVATTLQFGDSEGTPLFSSVWPGHEEAFVENLARFVRKYEYSEELCMQRSLVGGEQEGFEEGGGSSTKGSSQSEPAATSTAGSSGSEDASKELPHNPYSAQPGSVALETQPSPTTPSSLGGKSFDPPPPPVVAVAPARPIQQSAPVSSFASQAHPPIPPPAIKNPVAVVPPIQQLPNQLIGVPPIAPQDNDPQQPPFSYSQAGTSTAAFGPGLLNLPVPVHQSGAAIQSANLTSTTPLPLGPRSYPPHQLQYNPLTSFVMPDQPFGPYSVSQDLFSFADLQDDVNMSGEHLDDLLSTWDMSNGGTGKTWGDVLQSSALPPVDLSSFETSKTGNWFDINAFNAIAQQGGSMQTLPDSNVLSSTLPIHPVVPSPAHPPDASLLSNVSGAPQTTQSQPVAQSLPHPSDTSLMSNASGAPQTTISPSNHAIVSPLVTETSLSNPTGHDPTRSTGMTTPITTPSSSSTTTSQAPPPTLANTSFMTSMKAGFGESLFGKGNTAPIADPSKAKRGLGSQPVSLRKPSNKENWRPGSQGDRAGTTTLPIPPPPATLHPPAARPPTAHPPAPLHFPPAPPTPIPSVNSNGNPPATLHHPQAPRPLTPIPSIDGTPQDSTTCRSARGPVKNTQLEKQNLIGTNVVSHPANTATTTTKGEITGDEGPPPWFTDAVNHLSFEGLGDMWATVVHQWIALETSLDHGKVAKTPLPVQNRPEEWTKWAAKTKHGVRPYEKIPEINDPAEFGVAMLKWWCTIQPSFRISENNFPRPVFSDPGYDGDPWAAIRKSGPNGFIVFLTLLAWWGRSLSTPNPFKKDSRPAWNLLLQDVRLCLEEMSKSIPQAAEKRRHEGGDDGVQGHKRQKQS